MDFCAFSGYDTGRFWEDGFEGGNESQKARPDPKDYLGFFGWWWIDMSGLSQSQYKKYGKSLSAIAFLLSRL